MARLTVILDGPETSLPVAAGGSVELLVEEARERGVEVVLVKLDSTTLYPAAD